MTMTGDWTDEAACRGVHIDVFFPKSGGGDPYRTARKYCGRCPVRDACLHDEMRWEATMIAGKRRGRHGMQGGLTPQERERYAKGRKVA